MSKKDYNRRLQEFKKKEPKLVLSEWVDIVLNEYGCEIRESAHSDGSKIGFIHKDSGFVFNIHRPHKKGDYVHSSDHKKVVAMFINHGLIKINEK